MQLSPLNLFSKYFDPTFFPHQASTIRNDEICPRRHTLFTVHLPQDEKPLIKEGQPTAELAEDSLRS